MFPSPRGTDAASDAHDPATLFAARVNRPDVSREHLRQASGLLADAADRTSGEPADRLDAFADRLDRMTGGERDPDHGRLATVLLKLDEIADEVDDEGVAATIEEAREHVTEFRRTVEGV